MSRIKPNPSAPPRPRKQPARPTIAPPAHPAIQAIRTVVGRFVVGRELGSCFYKDLKHDEAAILRNPGAAFGWIVHPLATYMCGVPESASEARAELARSGQAWAHMVMGCTEGAELYFWDGVGLLPCVNADVLHNRMQAHRAGIAIAGHRKTLATLREDLAIAGEGVWADRLKGEIADIETQIAALVEIRDWHTDGENAS